MFSIDITYCDYELSKVQGAAQGQVREGRLRDTRLEGRNEADSWGEVGRASCLDHRWPQATSSPSPAVTDFNSVLGSNDFFFFFFFFCDLQNGFFASCERSHMVSSAGVSAHLSLQIFMKMMLL